MHSHRHCRFHTPAHSDHHEFLNLLLLSPVHWMVELLFCALLPQASFVYCSAQVRVEGALLAFQKILQLLRHESWRGRPRSEDLAQLRSCLRLHYIQDGLLHIE